MLRWGLYNALQALSLRGAVVPEQAHEESNERYRNAVLLPSRVEPFAGQALGGLEPSKLAAGKGSAK